MRAPIACAQSSIKHQAALVAQRAQRGHVGRIAAEVDPDDRASCAEVIRRATSAGSRLKSLRAARVDSTGSAPT